MGELIAKLGIFCLSITVFLRCTTQPNPNEKNAKTIDSAAYIKESLERENKALVCDTPYNLVDVIIIHDATNDDDDVISFYCNENEKGQVLSGGSPVKEGIFFPYVKPNFKISQNAIRHFAAYIDKKCECNFPYRSTDSFTYIGGYLITLMQGAQIKRCYVFPQEKKDRLDYLKGMKEWLEESRYKQEFSKFIGRINYILTQ